MREAKRFSRSLTFFERADSRSVASSGAPAVSREGAVSAENFNGNIRLDVGGVDRENRCAGAQSSHPSRGPGFSKNATLHERFSRGLTP